MNYLLFLTLSINLVQYSQSEDIIDINLPLNHLSQYFNSLPQLSEKISKTSDNVYGDFIKSKKYDREICWGYEYDCKKPSYTHKCPGSHTGYVKSKEAQLDIFYTQADFGYVKQQIQEMRMICEPLTVDDSSLECSDHLRFCRGRNLMINFTDLIQRKEPFRWQNDVLKPGEVGGYCKFNKELLDTNLMFMSSLQSWAPELSNFKPLSKRPIENKICDVIIEKPTFIMKLDSTINMYHHFCDFFNLYAAQHVNFTHPNGFSSDVNILIWETFSYWSPFSQTFEAFTENPIWNLNHFSGQVVCFKNVVFPLLPRMIYGLFYNTPIINGCENSALFNAFSEHILHRLQIPQNPATPKIRITFLSRKTKYRNVINEEELIERISSNPQYQVKKVVYDKNIKFVDQLKITHNSDIFIGIHGAGLTHLLFLPKWATLFELHNCGDPNCYKDLARLRGVNYITWEDDSFVEAFDAGYKDGTHEKFKNYKFNADEFGRLVAKAVKAVKNNKEYQKLITQDIKEEL